MTLYSPLEDFMHRTLSSIPGPWLKLQYIASLRSEGNQYEHWGLARVFGNEATQHAVEHAHRDVVLNLLRTPLAALMEEARKAAERERQPLNVYVQGLYAQGEQLLPAKLGGGSAKHFSSVLLALSSLAACPPPTHKAASLPVS
jgi:hypothetical protein